MGNSFQLTGLLEMQSYLFATRGSGQSRHLEVLLGEGDADDGDAEQHTKEEVHQAGP